MSSTCVFWSDCYFFFRGSLILKDKFIDFFFVRYFYSYHCFHDTRCLVKIFKPSSILILQNNSSSCVNVDEQVMAIKACGRNS